MADNPNVNVNTAAPGAVNIAVASDEIAGVQHPRVKVQWGVDGSAVDASATDPLPVATGGLTDAELRATPVPVSDGGDSLTVDGSVSVSGSVAVTGPLTDTQLRATAVPVSGPLTDAQLRDTPVPVSAASLPLPTGAATEFTLASADAALASIDGKTPALGQTLGSASVPVVVASDQTVPVSAASLPLPTGAATETTLASVDGKLPALVSGRVPIHSQASYAEDTPHTTGDVGNLMLALRSDNDAPTAGDGDYTILKLDEEGRLKVSTKPSSYPDITGNITAIQASSGTPVAGGTVAGDVSRASNVMAFCTGTFSTVNCTFEGSLESSGDSNWFVVQAVRSNANTIESTTGNLSSQPAYAWELSVNALRRVRVRCTALTSGTQSWRFVLGTYATEPIPAAQVSGTQPVSGTVTVTSTRITPNAADGHSSTHHAISAASTNATSVKGSAGSVGMIAACNINAAVRYLKLYNKATAPSEADTPVMTIALKPGETTFVEANSPIRFSTGIGYRLTTGIAVADTGSVAASEHSVSIFYT